MARNDMTPTAEDNTFACHHRLRILTHFFGWPEARCSAVGLTNRADLAWYSRVSAGFSRWRWECLDSSIWAACF
jgi:hypothetical protein